MSKFDKIFTVNNTKIDRNEAVALIEKDRELLSIKTQRVAASFITSMEFCLVNLNKAQTVELATGDLLSVEYKSFC